MVEVFRHLVLTCPRRHSTDAHKKVYRAQHLILPQEGLREKPYANFFHQCETLNKEIKKTPAWRRMLTPREMDKLLLNLDLAKRKR